MLLDDYTLTKFLGKGTFGEVYLTTKKGSDCLYATKRMEVKFVEDPKFIKYFKNEISILRKLSHKNIIKLEDLKKTSNHYYVIMEYCNGGTLTECLDKYKNIYHRPFTEEIVQHIMLQVVSAINYIHDLKIIHRDLKLDNILVKFDNEIDKNQMNLLKAEVKIIDFGFAAYKDQTGLLKTAIGSPLNMDPLILNKFNSGGKLNKELGYDEKADIWSLGTLCYQMLIGDSAFNAFNMKELVLKIEEGTYKIPTNLSKEVVSFLIAMLQYKPENRKSASELIKHAFLVKNVNDFTHINMKQVSNKVYNGQLTINIKENKTICNIFNEDDEMQLNKSPGEFFINETPLTESQYIDDINNDEINKKDMITSEPFDSEQNFIDKEFSQAKSIPIPGLNFGKSNSTPQGTPNKRGVDARNNQNPINIQRPQPLGQNGLQINGNNMITIMKKLDNGQIIKAQIPLEKYRQLQQQNGQNQNQINLMNKFQQIPMNHNPHNPAIRPVIPNNVNQMNQLQYPQMNLPHGGIMHIPHGPLLGQIQPMPSNQLQLNNNQRNQIPPMNIIQPNGIISPNQISTMNIPNKTAPSQITQVNKFQSNQMISNPNRINQNIPLEQVGINKLQQIGANLQQDHPLRKVITIQPNRQNQQLYNINTNKIQSGQIGISQPQSQLNQIAQIRQVNTINQAKLNNDNFQNKMIHPQIQINAPQKGLMPPQQQVKKIAIRFNQVNHSPGQLSPRIYTINSNRQLMNNATIDYSNGRMNPKLGKPMPGNNNIVLVQPLQRRVVSPGRFGMRPNIQINNRPNLLINKF